MVCGRLPFGDDSQIKKMTNRELHFTRPVSHGELVTDTIAIVLSLANIMSSIRHITIILIMPVMYM